jgi:23S rRNA pseudouridine2605 synthase
MRMSERLHKLLAQHGLGSRREIEKWMLAGRVILNNKPAQPGDRYENGDRVIVDGKDVTSRLLVNATAQVVAYHKPQGQPVEARSGQLAGGDAVDAAAETVFERLPNVRGARWLAINTMQAGDSGLLLLTTDGRLADALRRRSEHIPAAYVARVLVPNPEFDVGTISNVVRYDEQTIEFKSVEDVGGGEGTNRWFRIESPRAHRRAAVRALFESRGLGVSRVIQVRFGDLELPRDLPRGKHRTLNPAQVRGLYELAGLEPPRTEHGAGHHHRGRHGHASPMKRAAFTDNRRPGR